VLAGALGLRAPVPAPPLQLGVAVLALLAAVAEETPVLLVVDDAHWADGASACALLFAARRLGSEGVGMLFAMRDAAPRMPDTSGLDELVLEGLDAGSARALLAGRDVSDDVVLRMHGALGGNPLAMIEGASLLHPDQRSGRAPLDDVLRPGRAIERAFSRRLDGLSAAARRALLVASRVAAPLAYTRRTP
jgi:hypothetical protein